MTTWVVAHQTPLSLGFPRQEYWSGLPFPPPGDLPNSGIKPESSVSPALAGSFFTTEPPGKPYLLGKMELIGFATGQARTEEVAQQPQLTAWF